MSYEKGRRWVADPVEIRAEQLTPFSRAMGRATGYGVAEGDSSYHDDPGHAKELGYRTAVAWGLHTYGLIAQAVEDLLGAGLAPEREIAVRFTRPVFEGERITTTLTLESAARRPDRMQRLTLAARCAIDDGSTVAEGQVVVLARASAP
ncbi:MaoC family dehydratase [Microbacterium sp. No. 7]|uniref:MaoC family dehydratase n=1 Tax=Microbacterium sp. No. 7 TaxID=1714373 RepID=UPI0006D00F8C|nr:MaoC/PaaZ C-terminal domain-containing protein [Microbacterium sp. No. 7]ALJ21900.1 hypothetical protein AOA12_19150 [Microbacterium sp. No. 7]